MKASLLMVVCVVLAGCTPKYVPLDNCPYPAPPDPVTYLAASGDEQLTMVALSQSSLTEAIVTCNLSIDLHNAYNKAKYN